MPKFTHFKFCFMDKKLFGGLALILLLGAGCTEANIIDTTVNTGNPTETSAITADESEASGTVETGVVVDISGDMIGGDVKAEIVVEASVKEFTVTGGNFAFSPTSLSVNKGDTVRITFKNAEGFHDFVIDEFDVATKQISAATEETVEFVADQAGSFEFYCSVGQHRQLGMKGTLTVTE